MEANRGKLLRAAHVVLGALNKRIDSLSVAHPYLEEEHLPAIRSYLTEFIALLESAAVLEPSAAEEHDPQPARSRKK